VYGEDMLRSVTFVGEADLADRLRDFRPVTFDDDFRSVYSASRLSTAKEDLVKRLGGFVSRFESYQKLQILIYKYL
jgi:hypothetical protein